MDMSTEPVMRNENKNHWHYWCGVPKTQAFNRKQTTVNEKKSDTRSVMYRTGLSSSASHLHSIRALLFDIINSSRLFVILLQFFV